PTKGAAQRSKYGEEVIKMQKTTTYPYLEVNLTILDPKKMLVQHKRTYEITNKSDDPIYHVLHGIATDVEKYSLSDLNVQVFDEAGREMKISSINVNHPTSKEFTTAFNQPILKGEKNRKYTLVYEVEEPKRYFENAFLIDVNKFALNFKYPVNGCDCKPVLYDVNQETDKKTKSDTQPVIEKNGEYNIAKYSKDENNKGETIRIEW
ncbi:MAG: hypothetical protein IH842_02055, partial [Thaumarchaeota archaeon]|nr:hypothetical protein [Nitrososphaerota archaeon]